MKNSYAAIGRTVPEVGYRLAGHERLSVEGGELEKVPYSDEINSVKRLTDFVWLVTTETARYLFFNSSVAKVKDKAGKVSIGITDSVPKSRSTADVTIVTGIETDPVRTITVNSPVCNRVKGNRDVYYMEAGDKLYIVLINTR